MNTLLSLASLESFSVTATPTITYVTESHNYFAGKGGSRKAIDKMTEILGIDPKTISTQKSQRVMVTHLSYKELLLNRKSKEVQKALIEAQIEIDDVDLQFELGAIADQEKLEASGVEIKKRRNGTSVNGALAISSKDGEPMLTYYPVMGKAFDKKVLILGVEATAEQLESLKAFEKPYKEVKKSSTQEEMGLKKYFPTQSLRLENLLEVK